MFREKELSDAVAGRFSPDELKTVVRRGLMLIEQAERVQIVCELEEQMSRAGFSLSSQLILLGISARTPDELTPNEVGHLVRSIAIAAPRLMPAVERVLAQHIASLREDEPLAPAA